MKRISKFTEDRIDLKQMAALTGGLTSCKTGFTSSARSYAGCGDLMVITSSDVEYNNGITKWVTDRTITVDIYDFSCPGDE
jgi:hypothetical protein